MQQQNKTVNDSDSHEVVSEQPFVTELSWCVHPFVENWKRSVLLVLFLTLILLIIYLGFQSVFVLLFSIFLLVGPLYKYFLPIQYQLGKDDLVITVIFYKQQHPWSTFHSHYVDKNGVLLSPFSQPSRLENFRGVYVRFGNQPPEEVISFIQCKLNSEF